MYNSCKSTFFELGWRAYPTKERLTWRDLEQVYITENEECYTRLGLAQFSGDRHMQGANCFNVQVFSRMILVSPKYANNRFYIEILSMYVTILLEKCLIHAAFERIWFLDTVLAKM